VSVMLTVRVEGDVRGRSTATVMAILQDAAPSGAKRMGIRDLAGE